MPRAMSLTPLVGTMPQFVLNSLSTNLANCIYALGQPRSGDDVHVSTVVDILVQLS